MSKVVGIVSEGPTDYMVLKAVIDRITGEKNRYLSIQPEQNMIGQYGNGWKGVWKWCKEEISIKELMAGIEPQIDAIIVQMDGDVIRKEKEVHCNCDSTICDEKSKKFPLYCDRVKQGMCPVTMPCQCHQYDVMGMMEYGTLILRETLNENDINIVITIPCDSTDTWIVAAYEELDGIEGIYDPWRSVIARGKFYHGVRVRGDKKNTVTYQYFLKRLVDNWDVVTQKCLSADCLEREIKRIFS